MTRNSEFHDYVMNDIFADVPGITSRAMFSGWGIYKNKKIFAIIIEGELYFKTDERNRDDYTSRGSRPFVYSNKGKRVTMSYWLLPEEIMENRDELFEWIEKAASAGGQKSKGKRKA